MSRPAHFRLVTSIITAALSAGLLTACGSSDQQDQPEELTVFAAASLEGAFDEIRTEFNDEQQDYRIDSIVYDGSQALAAQVEDGADVDVVAFASEQALAPIEDSVQEPAIFAQNTLQLAVQPGNPKNIESLKDLGVDDASLVVCAPKVPCGQATQKLAQKQKITLHPVSEETNVTSVLRRVENGEADAGLVYTTDIAASDGVEGVEIPGAEDVVNRYPIALSRSAPSAEGGQAFIDFVLSDKGQKVLAEAGFGTDGPQEDPQ